MRCFQLQDPQGGHLTYAEKTYAFMDIGPLSKDNALVIAESPSQKLTALTSTSWRSRRTARASQLQPDIKEYHILQNNGKLAHQVVPHAHSHVVPEPSEEDRLQIGWPTQKADMEELKKYCEVLKGFTAVVDYQARAYDEYQVWSKTEHRILDYSGSSSSGRPRSSMYRLQDLEITQVSEPRKCSNQ